MDVPMHPFGRQALSATAAAQDRGLGKEKPAKDNRISDGLQPCRYGPRAKDDPRARDVGTG